MRTLILNGGGREAPFGEIAARAGTWARARGGDVAEFDLTAREIAPCRGCFDCWIKTPGFCFTRDAMDGIIRELAQAEFVFWITPIAFGGYGYHLKKALDRSIPILLPFFIKIDGEVHHPLRYDIKRRFAELAGFTWAGGLAMDMGGAAEGRISDKPSGLLRNVVRALTQAAAALAEGNPIPAETIEAFGQRLMPPWMYFTVANINWKRQAKKLGRGKDLYARPYAE